MNSSSDYAERQVLGALLNSENAANHIFDSLQYNHFHSLNHRAIFIACSELYNQDHEINPQTVHVYAPKIDISYLLELSFDTSEQNIQFYVDQLTECRMTQQYLDHLTGSITKIDNSKDITKTILETQEALENILLPEANKSVKTLSDAFNQPFKNTDLNIKDYYEKKRDDHINGKSTLNGLSSGYSELDEAIDGFQGKYLYIIGARPGGNKTSMLLNIMRNMIMQDIPIGFFSLELSYHDVVNNLAMIEGRTCISGFNKGQFTPYDFQKMIEACHRLEEKKLIIDDQPSLTINQIKSRTKRMITSHGIKALFIDYIQEVRSPQKHGNQQEAMQMVSRGIREMAKSLNIPVICAAQVNRESEKNETPRAPRASDLRESGQLEADAYVIAMLHRPDDADCYNKPGILEMYIRKNRFGPKKKINFNYKPDAPHYSGRIELLELVKGTEDE